MDQCQEKRRLKKSPHFLTFRLMSSPAKASKKKSPPPVKGVGWTWKQRLLRRSSCSWMNLHVHYLIKCWMPQLLRSWRKMVDLKREEEALDFLLEIYEKCPTAPDTPTPVFAEKFKADAPVLADLLVSDGLVEMQRKVQQKENGAVVVPCMILTAKGRTYFLKQQRERRISRKQFFQSASIAVISALLTLLLSQRSEESETSSS
nr:MAG TPA: hypothetical protein [Caudoviricetes sp.]